MDSRDIREKTPEIKDGKYLEEIYKLQQNLLKAYIQIEGLPEYPIDVNSKKSQIILKDFTGRVIEELGEGYESMIEVEEIANKCNYFQASTLLPGEEKAMGMIKNHIQNTNEELADALHFMMELLIYANIQPEDCYLFMEKVCKNMGVYHTNYGHHLNGLMEFGHGMVNGILFTQKNVFELDYRYPELKDSCTPVGWKTSPLWLNHTSIQLWDISYSLSISRNCLKNKPWKQSGELTDENKYQELLCESFTKLLGFYKHMGYTAETLFEVYFKKNCINQFRIASKY